MSAPVAIEVHRPDSESPPGGAATPRPPQRSVAAEPDRAADGLRMIAPDRIRPNPRQPRAAFDEASLDALAASIRTAGLMQPIVVRTIGDSSAATAEYELIAGERRWRAAQKLGLEAIPAVVREVDDRTAAEWALIENLQREDLNPMERADAFARLIEEFDLTHQQVAERVGLDRSSVTNLLRLHELEVETKDAVREGKLTLGHAKALLAITNIEARRALARRTQGEGWSVRELERRARGHESGAADHGNGGNGATQAHRNPAAGSAHLDDLQRQLAEHLGTKVAIQAGRTKGAGRLVIEFYSLDQFEGLMQRLGFTPQ